MIGAWGIYIFEISSQNGVTNTFDHLTDTNVSRYAEHKILQGIPLLEFVGEELITVTLSLNFVLPYTADPVAMLQLMKMQKSLRTPLPLIVGEALVGRDLLTLFVLTEIKTEWNRFYDTLPVQVRAACTFKEASSFGIGGIGLGIGGSFGPISGGVSIGPGGISGGISIGGP
jgi:phage protein U